MASSSDLLLHMVVSATAAEAIKAFTEINAQIESLKRSLTEVTGSSDKANETLDHLRVTADRVGVDALHLSKQFVNMAAAAKGTALEGDGVAKVFNTVAEVMGLLGKNTVVTERAFVALQQMLAKGTVSAEEWRGQLSEALPLANAAIQKATGITTAEFRKMMEAGDLLAQDVLPALARGLDELGVTGSARVDTLTASLSRFENAIQYAVQGLGESGGNAFLKGWIDNFSTATTAFSLAQRELSSGIGVVGSYVADLIPNFDKYAAVLDAVGVKISEYVRQQAGLTQTSKEVSATIYDMVASSISLASSYRTVADAATDATLIASKQTIALYEAAEASKQYVTTLGIENQSLQDIATAQEKLAAARLTELQARSDEVKKITDYIAVLNAQKDAIMSAVEADKMSSEEALNRLSGIDAQISKYQTLSEEKTAAADKAAALAEQDRLAAIQAKLAADTYGDQSDQLGALTDQLRSATDELSKIETAQREGQAAADALAAAQTELAEATAAYRAKMTEAATGNQDVSASLSDLSDKQKAAQAVVDALTIKVNAGTEADKKYASAKEAVAIAQKKVIDAASDMVQKREFELTQAERLTNTIKEEGDLRETHLRNLAREAAARGDVASASKFSQQAMEAEIATLQQMLAAKQAEAAAAQAAVAAKTAEAQIVGEIDAAEQAAIDTAQAAADAKSREADAIKEAIRAKEAEAEQTQKGTDATKTSATASDDAAGSVDRLSERQKESVKITRSWSEVMRAVGIDLQAMGEYAKTAEEAFARAYQTLWDASMSGVRNFGSFENYSAALRNIEERAKSAALAAADHARQVDQLNGRMEALNGQYERGEIGLGQYIAGLERAANGTTRLGEEDLQDLRNALSDARQEMDDFAESAQEGLSDLQQEWADLNGQQIEAMLLEQQMERIKLETELADAKKRGNAEEIAALQAQLDLLDKIHAKQLEQLAAEEAQKAIDAAEDAAAEAARRAGLTAEERAYEDLINSLKDQLADAILANNDALEASILAQIEAEKRRHEEYLRNLEIEKKARDDANQSTSSSSSKPGASTSGGASTSAGTTSTQPVKTVEIRVTMPSGQSGTINALPGDEDTLMQLFNSLETGRAVAA